MKGLILGGLVSVFYFIFWFGMRGSENIGGINCVLMILGLVIILSGILGSIGKFNFQKFLLLGLIPFVNNVIAEIQHNYIFVPMPLEQPLVIRAILGGLYGFVELTFFVVVSYAMLIILDYGSLASRRKK